MGFLARFREKIAAKKARRRHAEQVVEELEKSIEELREKNRLLFEQAAAELERAEAIQPEQLKPPEVIASEVEDEEMEIRR